MVDSLRLHDAAPDAPPTPTVEPLLVGAKTAAPLCGVGVATWWRWLALDRIPNPVRVGGKTLWRRAELVAWVEAGCPCRRIWEASQKGGRR